MEYPKFKCLDNDVVIEYNKEAHELYIACEGETTKIVVGVVDLKMALEKWNLCKVERSVRGNILVNQTLPSEEVAEG
jgi:hypothetical protein